MWKSLLANLCVLGGANGYKRAALYAALRQTSNLDSALDSYLRLTGGFV
jgi:hypothetical protein